MHEFFHLIGLCPDNFLYGGAPTSIILELYNMINQSINMLKHYITIIKLKKYKIIL
jgi:hypothetical protein